MRLQRHKYVATLEDTAQGEDVDSTSPHSFKPQNTGDFLAHCQPEQGTGSSLAKEVLKHL